MASNPVPKTKTYQVGGKTLTLSPMSYFVDVLDLPDLVAALFAREPGDIGALNNLDIYRAAKNEIRGLLLKCLDIDEAAWREIPMEIQAEIIADFMEINITENFMKALALVASRGRTIASAWPRPSSPPATDGGTSSATPAAKSKAS